MSAFSGKTVWITGASSGIGEALVYSFANEGANIILSARREEELKRVKETAKLNENNSLIIPIDLSKSDNYNGLAESIIKKFGHIDILINNGGISQRSYAKDTPLDVDRKIMETNFFGTIALTKSVIPHMVKQKSGNIIVISSIAGKFGFYLRTAYSASKHALHGFFESLRMELHNDNIKVLLVCPGKVKTNISYNALKSDGSKHNRMDESQEAGVSVEQCANEIINAIKKNKEEIYIGDGKGRMALLVKRLFPSYFSKQIRKQKPE